MNRIGMFGVLLFGAGIEASPTAWAQATPLFSEAQAQRGAAIYSAQCVGCHGANLTGGVNRSPPLTGTSFWAKWNDRTARKLYSLIITTMPANDPGNLTEPEVLDVMAFILHNNGLRSAPADIEHAKQLDTLTLHKESE